MKDVVVDVARRELIGKNVSRRLRRSGSIPAVLYGGGKDPVILQVDPNRIEQILRSESGVNTIFQLNLAGTDQRRHVMIREYQVDPLAGKLLHADFLRIAMDEAIEVEVPIRLTGESVGVKLDGGILEPVTRTVRVSCLPGDIPESLVLDVSAMKINDHLSVADLPKSDKFTLLSDPGLIVVVCAPPNKEEVAAPAAGAEAAAPAATEPEVIKKGKQLAEGEEGAEPEKEKKGGKPEAKK
ncbi:MAG TPA: 50S ribosomal protein L25 [Candidatus Polarisedimenticolia bacterium]|jgi:large subunit ribosomal protein L25|nr:50S ribosomal protein L25 [Candidatus Polarisedimenticolia bacterium]